MAVRESATTNGAGTRRMWFIAACLVVLFVAALFLRAYWNLDAANPSPGEFVLSGGSDPYYHKYAADQIQANGFRHERVIEDPMLNYPAGSENPNPPLYEWVLAAGGLLLDPVIAGDLAESTWQVTIWSPAIFGALTILPLYFLGAILFDRRVGLVAALFWTVSTAAIDSTGVGLADHDAAVVFFVTLSALFYVQTIRHFRGEVNWVAKWPSGIGAGLGRLFRERHIGFAYALLTGISIGALALTWKGSNYILGIILIYAGLQLVADHFRNRDTTGFFLATLLATLLSVVMAWPFYQAANVANFLMPAWYLVGFFAVAGAILVVTRDLPSLLVLPIMLVVGAIGVVVAFFAIPTVAQSLLYALVYFKQSRLYQTISEAQGADFSTIAFGIGPVPYLLALAGWFVLLFRVAARPVHAWIATSAFLLTALIGYILLSNVGDGTLAFSFVAVVLGIWLLVMLSIGETPGARAFGFALLWAAIALFMAQSAVRFLINAVPVFVLFAAFMTVWILDWLDFGSIRKSLAANRGNAWQGLRKGTRPLHIVAVVLIALLLVFPTTILAADAALPYESEQRLREENQGGFMDRFISERMGAYGGSFQSVVPWIPAFEYLDARDADTPPAERPGFLSWWDYGHWAIAIGKHPAVADNFQNGYEFAANFILSQEETHAIQLLAARLAEAEGADLQAALQEVGSADPAGDATKLRAWQKLDLTTEQSVELVSVMERQTGKSIRYFGVDVRMLPFDVEADPRQIEYRDIFAAPVTLKGDEPDDYVTRQYEVTGVPGGQTFVTLDRYEELARNPLSQIQVLGERYQYQQQFFETMFYRAYVGTPPQATPGQAVTGGAVQDALDWRNAFGEGGPRPGYGLQHFRAVYIGSATGIAYVGQDDQGNPDLLSYPDVIILEYTPGAIVRGTVTEAGRPLAGVTVTAFDDVGPMMANAFRLNTSAFDASIFNVAHGQATTDASGSFAMVVPFGNITLAASRGDVGVATEIVEISREAANARQTFDVTINVEQGAVEGIAYTDVDGNSTYTEGVDTPLAEVELQFGGNAGPTVTTGPDGRYRLDGLSAGQQPVAATSSSLQVKAGATVVVRGGTNVTHNVAIEPASATVSGTLRNATSPIAGSITFERRDVDGNTAVNGTGVANATGVFGPVKLRPGSYTVRATQIDGETTRTVTRDLELAAGQVVQDLDLVVLAEGETASEPAPTETEPATNETSSTPAP